MTNPVAQSVDPVEVVVLKNQPSVSDECTRLSELYWTTNGELDQLHASRAEEIADKIRQLKTWLRRAKGEVAFYKKMSDKGTALLRSHEMNVDEDV